MNRLAVGIFFIIVLVAATMIGNKNESYASADSCTGWMKQTNGCSERVCVDGKGRQYCEQLCGRRISRIKC